MSFINLYTCENGHQYLLSEKCPFCCAINRQEPVNESKEFMRIYNIIKDKSRQEIEDYYKTYVPAQEPEKPLNNFVDMFK